MNNIKMKPPVLPVNIGEYLARGGKFRIIEGDWKPGRIVLIRFPDEKSVDEFYNDPEYQPLKHLRYKVSHTDIVLVEGIEA